MKKARRSAYALFGCGFHGENGLDSETMIHLFKTYITPVLLYGMEVLIPKGKYLEQLTKFQKKMIKQLLSISSNTPDPAIYILTGLLPIEAQIHIRALTLFVNVCRQDEACIEKQLAKRQLRVQSMNSNSWFIEIQAIMYKYNLGDALYWIENPMKKEQAMKVIKKEVSDYWSKYIQDMAILYQGLRYLDFNNYIPEKLHKLLTLKCKSVGDRHRIPT